MSVMIVSGRVCYAVWSRPAQRDWNQSVYHSVREKSHYCVGVYLGLYAERGLLEEEWVLVFDRMRSARHTGQYSFNVSPISEEVKSALQAAKDFVGRMERLSKEA